MAETRITSGEFRGRRVETPPGREMRPTTALVRKALFDILGDLVVDATVLDLFAGSAAVAFEALSRGAARALAVERDRGLVALARTTAERLGCTSRLRAVADDVPRWIRSHRAEVARADIAFVDAPYRDDVVLDALDALGEAPPALVVCEHHRARTLPEEQGDLRRRRAAVYGTTQLTFYRRSGTAAPGAPAPETA